MTTDTPPTREELIARLQDLDARAKNLQARMQPQPSGVRWGRLLLMFGLPIAAGIVSHMAAHSLLVAILSAIGVFIVVIAIAIKMTPVPAHMKPGTRAWEAKLTADVLIRTIEQRVAEKGAADGARRERLEREIAFLSKQVDENTATWMSGDMSPGKGYVGFTPYDGQS